MTLNYTPDQDAIIIAMCNANATAAEIGAALGVASNCVYARAKKLDVQPRRLPSGRVGGLERAPACGRCDILLAYAPPGRDGLCGMCVAEGWRVDVETGKTYSV